ncbi:hypothetical protein TURU_123308 [Turdus rufiventris]|nr:hypothetical protein TURU_123308 [Turdus rufiventris]
MLFNILINDTDSGTERIPSRSGDGTKLSRAANTTEGWDIIQRDLDKLENWAYEHHEVQQVQVPGAAPASAIPDVNADWEINSLTKSSPVGEPQGFLMHEKLDMRYQCARIPQKAICILRCIQSSVPRWSREMIFSLYFSPHEDPPGVLCPSLSSSTQDMDLLECV